MSLTRTKQFQIQKESEIPVWIDRMKDAGAIVGETRYNDEAKNLQIDYKYDGPIQEFRDKFEQLCQS